MCTHNQITNTEFESRFDTKKKKIAKLNRCIMLESLYTVHRLGTTGLT